MRIIFAVGVCSLLLFYVVPKILSSISATILVPVHRTQSWIANSSDAFPQFFRDRDALINELNTYKYSQSAQSGDALTRELLSAENEELRSLLGDLAIPGILAGVIGRPSTVPYDVIVLDRGSLDGVSIGAPVFIGENAIIGVVEKVFDTSSVVTLITTPGFKTSVYVMGPNIYTNAEGIGGGLMKIGVPQGIPLSVGNLVILPGVRSGIYGAISHIESTPSEPEQSAFVSPEVPIASLRLVSIGKSPLSPISFEEAQRIVNEATQKEITVPIPDGVLVTADATTSTTTSATTTQQTTPTTP